MGPELIFKYFDVSEDQKQKFIELQPIYSEWNNRINVISRKDMEQFYERHVLHSLALAKIWQPKKGQKIIDVGTGGGFPGIPLAIMFPETEFTLVDSIGKKILVVKEVVSALNLKNVTPVNDRAEKVKGKFDFAVTRAVARLNKLVEICTKGNFKTPEILCLKGGDLEEELQEIDPLTFLDYPLTTYYSEEFFETKKIVRVVF